MPTYSTPGAYIEWQDASAPVIQPLRTDITGFIGLAQRGPLNTPVVVESVKQFEAHFGSFIGGGFLAYAMRGFFENGARRCWIVRVAAAGGARPATPASLMWTGFGVARWQVDASGPGVWGDGLALSVSAVFPARTFSVDGEPSTRWVNVASVANFQRADLLEIQQPGSTYYRVVSHVDPVLRRLYFVHPDAGAGLPYDRTLDGYDRDQPLHIRSLAYTISVRENGWPVGLFSQLTSIPEHPRYAPRVLGPATYPLVLPPNTPLPRPPPPIVITELAPGPLEMVAPLDVTPGVSMSLSGGADGLADLQVDDFFAGMNAIMSVDEIALVAAPDIVIQPETPPQFAPPPIGDPSCLLCPPADEPRELHQPPLSFEVPPLFSDDQVYRMQSMLVQLCEEKNDRFALLDPTAAMAEDAAQGVALVEEWRSRFDTRNAALYYPWLHVTDPLGVAPTRRVPPSGHVAGLAAQLDLEVGVHRAPANRVLAWAQDVTIAVDDARHGELNRMGINVLKSPPGLGLRVLGARTLSSDPSWRYINVRRLMLMLMKAINVQTQWAVFEPNDAVTRRRITQSLGELLAQLWQRGALVGGSPGEAFAVRCDEVNNPAESRADGRLVADVAVAPSRPFEYVVLRLGRQSNAFEVLERGTVVGGPVS
jgi:phage tail sheath protein FI